ncbi:MAG: flagellar hook-length control protein FliK [Lachnospiraceae bacterium]|nr:flagellar hook-length control protein FliK [Lachnospiraceae bacterium]
MSIRVTHENQILQNGGRNIGGASQAEESRSASADAVRLARNIRYMNVGDTFTGKITGIDGQALELLLADKSTLNAKLAQKMNLSLGQTMSFEITGNGGGKVSLTPLYANLAGDSQVAKALGAAQLPMDSRNAEMVQAMMREGMPIDVHSLLDMARTVASYPQAAPTSIVQMQKLGIPLSEENAEQFEIYKNNSHQIASDVSSLAEGYARAAGEDLSLNNALLEIFTSEDNAPSLEILQNALAKEGAEGEALQEGVEGQEASEEIPKGQEEIQKETAKDGSVPSRDATESGIAAGKAEGALTAAGEGVEVLIGEESEPAAILYGKNTVTEELPRLLTQEERNTLADRMEDLGVPKSITTNVRNGDMTTSQTLDMIKTAVDVFSKDMDSRESFTHALKGLTGSDEYGKLLKNEIAGRLLLSPEDVSDRDKVQDYYERVVRETAKLSQALSDSGRADTTLFKDTQNIRENVDFMNQLNQVFTYVQLPLKLNDQASHGDLYVYTNKKRLAEKNGSVSALLHLDMEHLGTMDVHVSMNNDTGNVKTHFIMQKEELLDFIADHLPELNERLEKRGYRVTSDVALNREEKNVPQIMFKTVKDERLVQKLSFDVKA